jgi:hypothetical protein
LWRENLVRAAVFPQGDQRRFTSPLVHTGRNLPGVRPVPGAGSVATARPHSTGGRQHGCYLPHFLMAGAHFAVREVDHKQDRRREGAGLRFKL